MFLRIEKLPAKQLVGKRVNMSLANRKTVELWSSFMPHRTKISNTIGTDLYSMQVYDSVLNMHTFTPQIEFEQWAAIEVSETEGLPEGMEPFILEGGLYAVFKHNGLPSEFPKTAQFIYGEWLPASNYRLDHRPHFEVLGKEYRNNHPDSEEEVWVPIKMKNE